jgi:hypothetical protein
MFKLGMKSNACVAMVKPLDVNPLMTSRIFFEHPKCLHVFFFKEYFKLVEIAMVQVLGSIEDE